MSFKEKQISKRQKADGSSIVFFNVMKIAVCRRKIAVERRKLF